MTNGEKFKTVEERAWAFRDYHEAHYHAYHDLPWDEHTFNKVNSIAATVFSWLERDAEDEKPLPCPFCGSKTSVVEHPCTGTCWVSCENGNCHYCACYADNENEAISKHNRVAKAALAVKEAK